MTPTKTPDLKDWYWSIGHFVMNFGHLEFLVFAYLEKHVSTAEFEQMRKTSFQNRIEKVAQLFGTSPERTTRFAAFAQRLEPIRNVRNHVAHGFLEFGFSPTAELFLDIARAKDSDRMLDPVTEKVTYHDLWIHVHALGDLITEFQRLTNYEPRSEPGLPRLGPLS
jgi:hypothetical protein